MLQSARMKSYITTYNSWFRLSPRGSSVGQWHIGFGVFDAPIESEQCFETLTYWFLVAFTFLHFKLDTLKYD